MSIDTKILTSCTRSCIWNGSKKSAVAFVRAAEKLQLPLRERMPFVSAISIVPCIPSVLIRMESMKDGRDL